mmetsp:Transcript_17956/g.22801  ORF Transcript_17956/g.22801 Transcript_17956/m.22801 type:complete len:150 (+) Transcript_17956:1232-1681(+)
MSTILLNEALATPNLELSDLPGRVNTSSSGSDEISSPRVEPRSSASKFDEVSARLNGNGANEFLCVADLFFLRPGVEVEASFAARSDFRLLNNEKFLIILSLESPPSRDAFNTLEDDLRRVIPETRISQSFLISSAASLPNSSLQDLMK